MNKFWADRVAIGAALLGILLMVLTLVWRVNPSEGSVIPAFLHSSPVGEAVLILLLVTCMPVWILTVSLITLIPVPYPLQYPVACGVMLVLQALLYFLIGKILSFLARRLARRNASPDPGGRDVG